MKSTKDWILLFLIIFLGGILSNSPVFAQDMCHLIELKVHKVKGRVISNDEENNPISSTKVELYKVFDNKSLIDSTITDKNGFFEIDNVKEGEYGLRVWATVEGNTFFKYDLILKVIKSNKKKPSKTIIVQLGVDCHSSSTKLIDS